MADINKIIGIGIEDKASAGLNKIDKGITKVTQSTKTMTKETKGSTQAIVDNGGAMGLLNQLTGGLAMTFKDASEAIGLAGISLKSFKGILMTTGIGALVIAIGYLIENFDKLKGAIDGSTEAANDYTIAMSQIETKQRVFSQISNEDIALLEKKREELIKNGATQKELAEQDAKINDEKAKQLQIDIDSNKARMDELDKLIAKDSEYQDLLKERAEASQQLAKVRGLLNETDIFGLPKASEWSPVYVKMVKDAEEGFEDADEALNLYLATNEKFSKQAELIKKSSELAVASIDKETDAIREGNEETAKSKALRDAKIAQAIKLEEDRLKKLQGLLESYTKKNEDLSVKTELSKIDLAEKRAMAELDSLKANEKEKQDVHDYYNRLRMEAIDKLYEANKEKQKKDTQDLFDELRKNIDEELVRSQAFLEIEAMQQESSLVGWLDYYDRLAMISETSQSFLASLQDESLVKSRALRDAFLILEKGLAVANVWIGEAQSSATAKFNASMVPATVQAGPYTIPNPMKPVAMASAAKSVISNKINAGIATATILAQTIAGLNKGGSGGGSGDTGIGGGGNPQAQFNVVQSSGTNQLASTIASQQNQSVEAFVVSSSISTAQALDRNKIVNATFLVHLISFGLLFIFII